MSYQKHPNDSEHCNPDGITKVIVYTHSFTLSEVSGQYTASISFQSQKEHRLSVARSTPLPFNSVWF
jgi:hypothetical protein